MHTLCILGDSTSAGQPPRKYPRVGWGTSLSDFLASGWSLLNASVNGQSTKSLLEGDLYPRFLDLLGCGDWVLVQFGHNDEGPDPGRHVPAGLSFQANLSRIVRDIRLRRADVILLGPTERLGWKQGHVVDSHAAYVRDIRRVSEKMGVEWLDVGEATRRLYEKLGPEEASRLFVSGDTTHFVEKGAQAAASLVCSLLGEREFLSRP